jgi:hypothetical protein
VREGGFIKVIAWIIAATAVDLGIATAAWSAQAAAELPPAAAAPTKLLKHPVQLKDVLREPKFPAQLLSNFKTAMDRDFLLEINFYNDDVLKEFVGGAPPTWRETTREGEGRRILTRVGTINLRSAGVPNMTVAVQETVITLVGHEIVRRGAQPADQKVYGSITVDIASTPDICVCDVRDWFGLETDVRAAPSGTAKALLVYEFPATASSEAASVSKNAEFAIRADDSAPIGSGASPGGRPFIRGRDPVERISVREAGK